MFKCINNFSLKLICIVFISVLQLTAPINIFGKDAGVLAKERLQYTIANNSISIVGMHDTIGGQQANGFKEITLLCGRQPSLWSTDFGFSTHPNDSIRFRQDILTKVRQYNAQGVMILISWHQCNPLFKEPCTFMDGVQGVLSDKGWAELLSGGTELNTRWKNQMDLLASYLKEFQRAGIPVLLRPYHESNIPGFWWASENPENSKRLWKQLHDYYTTHHRLNNLLWVWSASFHPRYWSRVSEYYPGDDVVDVIGLDIYPPTKNGAPDFEVAWKSLKDITPKKPLALSEISRLPTQEELSKRNWAFVVPWGINMLKRDNSDKDICDFYSSEKNRSPELKAPQSLSVRGNP